MRFVPSLHRVIMPRIKNRLANDGDGTHQRIRITLGAVAGGGKCEMLNGVRPQDELIGITLAEQRQRAGAAINAFGGNHVGGRKA